MTAKVESTRHQMSCSGVSLLVNVGFAVKLLIQVVINKSAAILGAISCGSWKPQELPHKAHPIVIVIGILELMAEFS